MIAGFLPPLVITQCGRARMTKLFLSVTLDRKRRMDFTHKYADTVNLSYRFLWGLQSEEVSAADLRVLNHMMTTTLRLH